MSYAVHFRAEKRLFKPEAQSGFCYCGEGQITDLRSDDGNKRGPEDTYMNLMKSVRFVDTKLTTGTSLLVR